MDFRRWRLFKSDANDARLLDEWRAAALTYHSGQTIPGAHADHYEERLAVVADALLFGKAADHLLRYHFYPDDVMVHTSDFRRERRRMRVGDRIVQRIRAFRRPVNVDVLTMNEVVSVTEESRRAGFVYATTDKHEEIGRWAARLEWRDDDSLWLVIDSYGWPNVPPFMQAVARRTQLRAHRRGIAHFRSLLAS